MAVDERRQVVLAGSCMWSGEPVDVRHYAELQRTVAVAGLDGGSPYLALFSRSGFTPRLRELAAAQDPARLLLVGLEKMYSAGAP